jgi:hypothetical protein
MIRLIVFIASIIFINYTTVHTPPGGTVTVTPLATVTGPNVPAFRDTGIV